VCQQLQLESPHLQLLHLDLSLLQPTNTFDVLTRLHIMEHLGAVLSVLSLLSSLVEGKCLI
jgi:2-polyprenyl-3-methyl-5-hydroxy-6-metoxy-1,4-benzoquinol methylase